MSSSVSPFLLLALVICLEVTSLDAGHVMKKRSDDVNPLEAVVSKLTQDMTQMQARVTALENARSKRVAFFGMQPTESVKGNTPIPFTPSFNIGNAYDANLHVFVAPYPGVYLFNFQIFSQQNGDLLVDLIKNGGIVVRMRVYDLNYVTSEASSVTQHAAAGDRFWLTVDHDMAVFAGVHSFFSATLILADV